MGGRQSLANHYTNHYNQQRLRHTNTSNVNLPTATPYDRCLLCQQVLRQEQEQTLLPASTTSILLCSSMSLCCLGARTQLSHFSVLYEIGRGAFGKVYIVLHRPMRCHYALKCISKRRLVHKAMGTNVLRELELLQNLNHTFITNLWFTFQDDDYIFIISDLFIGGDLRQHLNDSGRFSEARAKLYACEIALALDYLHQRKIAHRDIKPENLLLDTGGHAHVTDFNLAVKIGEPPDGLATSFTGTRLYMAPEVLMTSIAQLAGYDQCVDWWSLGICFFEMIHGRRPFEFPSSFSSLQVLQLISGSLVVPSHWTSDLSSFVNTMLNFDMKKRIDSFEKFKSHRYMERINMDHILLRKTAPVYIPKPNRILYEVFQSESKGNRFSQSDPLNLRLQRHKLANGPFSSRVRNLRQNGFHGTTASTPQHQPTESEPSPSTFQQRRRRGSAGTALSRKMSYRENQLPREQQQQSQQNRKNSTVWMVEIAHLTLSFQEFNRFQATPIEPEQPKSKKQIGLLLTQSLPTDSNTQKPQEKVTNCLDSDLNNFTPFFTIVPERRTKENLASSNLGHIKISKQFNSDFQQTNLPSSLTLHNNDVAITNLNDKDDDKVILVLPKPLNSKLYASADQIVSTSLLHNPIEQPLERTISESIFKPSISDEPKIISTTIDVTLINPNDEIMSSNVELVSSTQIEENNLALNCSNNSINEFNMTPIPTRVACIKRLAFCESREYSI